MEELGSVLGYLSLASAVKHVLHLLWGNRLPSEAEYVGKVSEIYLYPIKSTGGIRLETTYCSDRGATSLGLLDRQFGIINEKGSVLTGRTTPKISSIKTWVEGTQLILSSSISDQSSISIDWTQVAKRNKTPVKLHDVLPLEGKDCGDEVAAWLDKHIGSPGHRLMYKDRDVKERNVYYPPSEKVMASFSPWVLPGMGYKTQYQDVSPYMIMTSESLEDLNTKLENQVSVNRFRPNIVVTGTKGAYDEDTWKNVYIGNSHFRVLSPCGRCVFTTVNPEKGERDKSNEPLKTLRSYRSILPEPLKNSPAMGNLVLLRREGQIKVGDPVYVTRGIINKPGDIQDF